MAEKVRRLSVWKIVLFLIKLDSCLIKPVSLPKWRFNNTDRNLECNEMENDKSRLVHDIFACGMSIGMMGINMGMLCIQ